MVIYIRNTFGILVSAFANMVVVACGMHLHAVGASEVKGPLAAVSVGSE